MAEEVAVAETPAEHVDETPAVVEAPEQVVESVVEETQVVSNDQPAEVETTAQTATDATAHEVWYGLVR